MSTAPTTLSAVKLALAARQRRGSEDASLLRAEPIAVIGIGCRFPGGSTDPERYWDLLRHGVDAVGQVPHDRWDVESLYDPDRTTPGKVTTRQGAFLEDIDRFDPAFFGIAPREAATMDPQQRLLLEVAWEGLEDAGLVVERLAGSRTGVFVASYNGDYGRWLFGNRPGIDAYTLSGNSHSIVSGRLSFLYDFRGPSITVDTACSASLVAVHLACQSLRAGECDLALTGGVSLILGPEGSIAMSKWGMLAPDGRCKTFDASADGFGRGEGCGIVVLKRLADALADGDPVRAIIRGTAVNQDGRSAGLTAPNGLAQQAVIREALDNARVEPGRVGLVEAHGTGTAIGDPIEVESLAAVLGRAGHEPCALGSVKTNFGHLEAAAGIAGLIKLVLAFQHEAIPAHLHFRRLNPHISLDGTRLFIPTELRPWPRSREPRFAGVSSFGFGGTNAHVVLEEAPRLPAETPEPQVQLLTLSARSSTALRAMATRYADALANPTAELGDVCFTASVRRTHHPHRLAVTGATFEELRSHLQAYGRAKADDAVLDAKPGAGAPRTAFVFSGQGPQWWAMGRELLGAEPVFRQALEQTDAALARHTGWSVLAELRADEPHSRLGQTEFAQPALFAVQYALAALWRAWGVAPRAVVGHSVGEVAAACVAGALSVDQAAQLVAHRGRIMQRATGLGRMAAVELPAAELESLLVDFRGRLSLAAINNPRSVVVSGEAAALDEILRRISSLGVSWRYLPVDYAFHSPQMEPFKAELVSCLEGLVPTRTTCALVSSVTGKPVEGPELDGRYWATNLRAPVRFAAAVDRLLAEGYTAFIEVAPHPVLSAHVVECARSRDSQVAVLPSIRRGKAERATMLGSLGTLYTLGAAFDGQGLHPRGGRCVSLPTYPWQRERYWLHERAAAPLLQAGRETGHRLLGRRQRSALSEGQFEAILDHSRLPYVADHEILGGDLLPATACFEAGLAAAATVLGPSPYVLEDVTFEEPLALEPKGTRVTQLTVQRVSNGAEFTLFSQTDGDQAWIRHCRGRIVPAASAAIPAVEAESAAERLGVPCSGAEIYATLRRQGLHFGPRFRAISRAWLAGDGLLVELQVPPELESEPELRLPPLLDACLQGLNALPGSGAEGGVFVPVGADHFRLSSRAAIPRWARAVVRGRRSADTLVADVHVFGDHSEPVAEWVGLRLRRTTAAALWGARHDPVRRYELSWRSVPAPAAAAPRGLWMVFEDRAGVGEAVAATLTKDGGRCLRVRLGQTFEEVDGLFQIDGSAESFARLFERVAANAAAAIDGAVYLWALDQTISEDERDSAMLEHLRHANAGALHLARSLSRLAPAKPPRLVFVTRGAQGVHGDARPVEPVQTSLWGLRAALELELPELRCTAIDLDPAGAAEEARALAAELSGEDGEGLVVHRGGQRRVARLVASVPIRESAVRADTPPTPERLESTRRGVLDSLDWKEAAQREPRAGEVQILVHATGLNFRDVLNALDLYPGDPGPLGDECAGIVTAVGSGVTHLKPGDAVMAFVPGAFTTTVTAPADLAVPTPRGLGLAEAAAVPIAFMTAEHSLVELAGLEAGQSVLIHAAAGGVGLAAVEIARRRGARVFATAGSVEKREYLKSLGIRHVMDSRSMSFADEVMTLTSGLGVDVVLNSLAGDFIPRSLSVVRRGGSFVEIGRTGIWSESQVAALGRDIRYHVVFLGAMRDRQPDQVRRMLTAIAERMSDGRLSPTQVRTFPREETVEAFRFMSQARHIGKIVVTHEPVRPPAAAPLRADASYLITGGLGAVGLSMAQALADAGARHLVLAGRSEPDAAARAVVERLGERGVQTAVVQVDVTCEADVARLLQHAAQALAPLRGIVHAAGVLDDGVLVEQSWERFARVLAPKALGAWNLHRLTRGLELDFFVCFSSVASWLGWPGQGTYGAANAFLDGFAHRRRALGARATSVAWGPWADAGMAARLGDRDRRRLQEHGLQAIPRERAAELAVRLLEASTAQTAVLSIDWNAYAARFAGTPRLVSELVGSGRAGAAAPAPVEAFADTLASAPPARRRALLRRRIEEHAGRILGLGTGSGIDPARPLRELGLDSLMAVEVRNALAALTGRALPATLLFDYPTIDAIAGYLLSELAGANRDGRSPDESPEVAEVATLSDQEAEALLLKELDSLRGGGGDG